MVYIILVNRLQTVLGQQKEQKEQNMLKLVPLSLILFPVEHLELHFAARRFAPLTPDVPHGHGHED